MFPRHSEHPSHLFQTLLRGLGDDMVLRLAATAAFPAAAT